jgi:putative tryptophan/tyrosine transport system substrate-binding protein
MRNLRRKVLEAATTSRVNLMIAICILAAPLAAGAQQPGRIPRIGVLYASSASVANRCDEGFRHGLAELGYVDGKSVLLEVRWAEGKVDRARELAAELVSLKVDVIFAPGTMVAQSVKQATGTMPIIIASAADPIGSGLIEGFGHPGGNVTGLSMVAGPEIAGKYLELLRQAVPRVSPIAVIANPNNPAIAPQVKAMEDAARGLGVKIHLLALRKAGDLDGVFAAIGKRRVGALVVVPDPLSQSLRVKIAKLALKHRLPSMFGLLEEAEAGGLMAYGVDFRQHCRRVATFVDKILKGAKSADLPVEQPTKFELVINLKTAKALGLTIPSLLLARADQVIE